MFHACVERFDVTDTVWKILGTKRSLGTQAAPMCKSCQKKIQNSDANSEVPETQTSQRPFKSDLTSTSAAEVSDKNTSKGFAFTFPIPKAPSSLFEPPPTPTLASPPMTLLFTTEDIPKFSFGSSGMTNKLIFSFDSTSGYNKER